MVKYVNYYSDEKMKLINDWMIENIYDGESKYVTRKNEIQGTPLLLLKRVVKIENGLKKHVVEYILNVKTMKPINESPFYNEPPSELVKVCKEIDKENSNEIDLFYENRYY